MPESRKMLRKWCGPSEHMTNPLDEITHTSTLAPVHGGQAGQPLLAVDTTCGVRPTADSSMVLRPAVVTACTGENTLLWGNSH